MKWKELPIEDAMRLKKHDQERMPITFALIDLVMSGYAGVSSEGRIVDRRKYPNAIPLQQNTLLGVPEPKEITAALTEAGEGEK